MFIIISVEKKKTNILIKNDGALRPFQTLSFTVVNAAIHVLFIERSDFENTDFLFFTPYIVLCYRPPF